MEAANAELLALCKSYFGEWAPYMIFNETGSLFKITTVKDKFPSISLGKATGVRQCYIKYSHVGTDFRDVMDRERTKINPSEFIIVFDGPRTDEERSIYPETIAAVLKEFFNIDEVASVCRPLKQSADEKVRADKANSEATSLKVNDSNLSKVNISAEIVASMELCFAAIYADILKRAETNISGYSSLSVIEKQEMMSNSAWTAFYRMFPGANGKIGTVAAGQLFSNMQRTLFMLDRSLDHFSS